MKKRTIKRLIVTCFFLFICIIIFENVFDYEDDKVDPEMLSKIIHGGGVISDEEGNGYYYSNSLEAIDSSYKKGKRVIELDFDFTSDNELVLIHDWNSKYCSLIVDEKPISKEEFLSCKIYDNFTSLSIDELIEYLKNHKDLYIVTDIKDRNIEGSNIIADKSDELKNRFIIQIYNIDEYKKIEELGFKNIIFTLYKLNNKDKLDVDTLKYYSEEYEFLGYTFDAKLLENEGYLDKMKECNTSLFVHNIKYDLGYDYYYELGIKGVYTDFP